MAQWHGWRHATGLGAWEGCANMRLSGGGSDGIRALYRDTTAALSRHNIAPHFRIFALFFLWFFDVSCFFGNHGMDALEVAAVVGAEEMYLLGTGIWNLGF